MTLISVLSVSAFRTLSCLSAHIIRMFRGGTVGSCRNYETSGRQCMYVPLELDCSNEISKELDNLHVHNPRFMYACLISYLNPNIVMVFLFPTTSTCAKRKFKRRKGTPFRVLTMRSTLAKRKFAPRDLNSCKHLVISSWTHTHRQDITNKLYVYIRMYAMYVYKCMLCMRHCQ